MPQHRTNPNIEIRSEEVQEILSHIPNWIIRWGITVILVSVLAIIVASWFIKYPDVVKAKVTITTPVPPVSIVANTSGSVDFMIEDNEVVKNGQPLGIINNSANTKDVFHLISLCKSFKINENDSDSNFNKKMSLGSMQSTYLEFNMSLNKYSLFKRLNYYTKQIVILRARVDHYQDLNRSLGKQLEILKSELGIVKQNFQMDSTLYSKKFTSKVEKNKAKAILLQANRNFELTKSNLINYKIQINQLNGQIADLLSKKLEEETSLKAAINQSFERLKSELESWKQQYLLTSPINGAVSFNAFWTDNQYVKANEEVITIISEETIAFGRVELPVQGSGKVNIGQKVNIKLDGYPYQEYGMLLGHVKSKSILPKNNTYVVTLELSNGLITSYNKKLSFDREMQGNAEIITKDLRIMGRIFNQFRALLDQSS